MWWEALFIWIYTLILPRSQCFFFLILVDTADLEEYKVHLTLVNIRLLLQFKTILLRYLLLKRKCSRSVVSYSLQPHPWGFSRQEYWSELPFSSPENLSKQGSNPGLPHCRLFTIWAKGSPCFFKVIPIV